MIFVTVANWKVKTSEDAAGALKHVAVLTLYHIYIYIYIYLYIL